MRVLMLQRYLASAFKDGNTKILFSFQRNKICERMIRSRTVPFVTNLCCRYTNHAICTNNGLSHRQSRIVPYISRDNEPLPMQPRLYPTIILRLFYHWALVHDFLQYATPLLLHANNVCFMQYIFIQPTTSSQLNMKPSVNRQPVDRLEISSNTYAENQWLHGIEPCLHSSYALTSVLFRHCLL